MDNRMLVYGISALAIVLYHVNKYVAFITPVEFLSKAFTFLFSLGNGGVDAFFFFSAIGLCSSMKRHSVQEFYANRLKRIVAPFLMCSVFFYIWHDFVLFKDGILQFILNITTINYWIKGSTYTFWYVSAIVGLYLFFPLIMKFCNHRYYNAGLIVLFSVVIEIMCYLWIPTFYSKYELLLSRLPIFFMGVFLYDYYLGKKSNTKLNCIVLLLIGVLLVIIEKMGFPKFINRYLTAVSFICMLHVFAWILGNIHTRNLVLSAIGSVSLELYIIHVAFFQPVKFYELWDFIPHMLWYVIFLGISIPLAFLVSQLSSKIIKQIANNGMKA